MNSTTISFCTRCGCRLGHSASGECFTRGQCEVVAAGRSEATEEDRLIADALYEFSNIQARRFERLGASEAEKRFIADGSLQETEALSQGPLAWA